MRATSLALIAILSTAGACTAASDTPTFRPITGYLSADYFTLASQESDPSSAVSYQIVTHYVPAAGSKWTFDLNLRSRHHLDGLRRSTRYVYDAKAAYRTDSVGAVVGRMSVYDIGSIGTFDGGRVDLPLGSWVVGGFGGYVPDLQTAAFSSDSQTFGGYATRTFQNGSRSDMAFAELRRFGQTERRWVSVQNFLYVKPGTSLYQSAEYELGNGIPAGNRLARFLASGSAALTGRASVSGSFSFGRAIDYQRIALAGSAGEVITDPGIVGAFYYENATVSMRYRVTPSWRILGGFALFRRSQSGVLVRQVRMGVSGEALAGISFSGNYARSFDDSGGRGVLSVTASRSFGDLSVDVSYSNYGDAIALVETGTVLQPTLVPGYRIVELTGAYRLTNGLSVVAEVQRASGADSKYTTFFLRSSYRIR
ncbi:MAG: hypothetical protein HYX75_17905 [Acidobacteria bacterium]|nr:hypothetical protein [Acidobacteriota bacterium]